MKLRAANHRVLLETPAAAQRRVQALRNNAWMLLSVGVVLLMAPAGLHANQVFKACGKKWVRQATKLEAEKLAWLSQQRSLSVTVDLDDDGELDLVELTNTASFRNCDIKNFWDRKEITVRIDYGNGRTQLFHWISGQLVEQIKIYRGIGRILLVGSDADGQPTNKWVDYQATPAGHAPAMVAAAPAREREAGESVRRLAEASPAPANSAREPTRR